MKKMKRFATLAAATILAVSMVTASAISVSAAVDAATSITINDAVADKTYTAYQIFNAKTATNDITWGNGVKGDDLLTALKADTSAVKDVFADANSAADVAAIMADSTKFTEDNLIAMADIVADYVDGTGATATFADGKYTLDVGEGYYLIVDSTNNVGADAANSRYLVNVSGATTVTPKISKPTLDKEIYHDELDSWGDVGDNAIGDEVKFKITTTVPDTTGYETYTYTVRDDLDTGLTLNADASAFSYKYYDKNGDEITGITYVPTLTFADDSATADFTEDFNAKFDIKALLNENSNIAKIETYYSAVLNGDAKVANAANDSTNYNPNTAYLTYMNNPAQSGEGETENGKTPEVTVYDWTFTFNGTKVDGETNAPLANAVFKLYKGTEEVQLVKGAAEGDVDVYRVKTAADTAEAVDIITNDACLFRITGLNDTVEYTLKETETPSPEYNHADPVKFTLSADYDTAGSTLTTLAATGDTTTNAATITNNKGSVLPTTGGIGTKVFYGIGGTVAVGAGVLLVAKKRMKKEEE